jgi:hypothetical protein
VACAHRAWAPAAHQLPRAAAHHTHTHTCGASATPAAPTSASKGIHCRSLMRPDACATLPAAIAPHMASAPANALVGMTAAYHNCPSTTRLDAMPISCTRTAVASLRLARYVHMSALPASPAHQPTQLIAASADSCPAAMKPWFCSTCGTTLRSAGCGGVAGGERGLSAVVWRARRHTHEGGGLRLHPHRRRWHSIKLAGPKLHAAGPTPMLVATTASITAHMNVNGMLEKPTRRSVSAPCRSAAAPAGCVREHSSKCARGWVGGWWCGGGGVHVLGTTGSLSTTTTCARR